ncbi:flagellar biosynthetic protein FliQ [Thermovibrio ammonificans HB-1]|uniref:Flagellar biosynthetic protein FliQ n=1 Tax=Thermovibrio ammonificans (strain DSM 15698 / JCM 12110 / HB-1) TaxID=648996 RepID=E8T475_THEA1|nr:flagellar biosynthesis protein FliQ [Thermovibrio ammonificans]ADU97404.1 flagellar biosynthetic protein FliQ [Thermovibrio ammonificans HB-1]
MTVEQIIFLGRQMLEVALLVGAPVLLITFFVGIAISVLQAATQIHEMTLTFIPKILAAFVAIFIFGGWMFMKLVEYTKENFQLLLQMVR